MTSLLDDLAQFARGYQFPGDYPPNIRVLLSPRHDGHGALLHMLGATTQSLVGGMYGFTDPDIAKAYARLCQAPHIATMLSLDHVQSAGRAESAILSTMHAGAPGASVAIGDLRDAVMRTVAEGTSSVHGAISHLKQWVIDARYVLDGSMNESESGEEWQNNSLIVIDDRAIAGQVQANLMLIHTEMLKQMAARAAKLAST